MVSVHVDGHSFVVDLERSKTPPKPNKMPHRIIGRVCEREKDELGRKASPAEESKLLKMEEERLKYDLIILETHHRGGNVTCWPSIFQSG